mmetsp:Transcript_30656/g.91742  ORF Transcript_30656/g.91742 Transcript_30656/m.91742 type:complete len:320 (-) Transcript_30656:145-1104(-)
MPRAKGRLCAGGHRGHPHHGDQPARLLRRVGFPPHVRRLLRHLRRGELERARPRREEVRRRKGEAKRQGRRDGPRQRGSARLARQRLREGLLRLCRRHGPRKADGTQGARALDGTLRHARRGHDVCHLLHGAPRGRLHGEGARLGPERRGTLHGIDHPGGHAGCHGPSAHSRDGLLRQHAREDVQGTLRRHPSRLADRGLCSRVPHPPGLWPGKLHQQQVPGGLHPARGGGRVRVHRADFHPGGGSRRRRRHADARHIAQVSRRIQEGVKDSSRSKTRRHKVPRQTRASGAEDFVVYFFVSSSFFVSLPLTLSRASFIN